MRPAMAFRLSSNARRTALATALIVASSLAFASPAQAQTALTGSWVFTSYKEVLSAPCAMILAAEDGDGRLTAYVGDRGAIGFIFALAERGIGWREGDTTTPEFLVDGVPVEMGAVTLYDPTAVRFESRAAGRQPGSLLQAVERGQRAVVQIDGRRHTFDLTGTTTAVRVLSQCDVIGGWPKGQASSAPSASITPDTSPVPPQPEAERQGAWEIGAVENPFGSRCLMVNRASPDAFLAAHLEGERTRFVVRLSDLDLVEGSMPKLTLSVDGQAVAMAAPSVFDSNSVILNDRPAGERQAGASASEEGAGAILNALRRGWVADVRINGREARFRLGGTIAALGALGDCEERAALRWIAEAEAAAAAEAEITLEVEGDRADAGLPPLGETDPKKEETPGASPGLGGVLDRYAGGQTTPLARYRCAFVGPDLFGIPDRPGTPPDEALLIVNDDGSLLLNGSTVAPRLRTY